MKRIIFLLLLQVSTSLANPIVSNLIEPVSYFTGRIYDFQKLNFYLSKYKNTSIIGFSGIGKSQLIRMYSLNNNYKYEIIWFFDCESDIGRQFINLSREINVKFNNVNKLLLEDSNAKQDVLNYLSSKKRWLLIFDNLKINNNNIINDIINLEHNGHIIFCSQDSNRLPNPIRLSNLSGVDSEELINKVLFERSEEDKKILNNIFDGHPYIIVQGASLLNNNNYLKIEDYKNLISNQDNIISDHIKIVLQQLSGSAIKMLYKIILLDHRFSRNCLKKIISEQENEISDLTELKRFSLINEVVGENNIQIFEMHDTTKNALLNIIDKAEISNILEEIISSMHNALPKRSLSRYKLFVEDSTLLNNIEALERNARNYKVSSNKILNLIRHRIVFYSLSRDHKNLNQLQELFNHNNNSAGFDFSKMNDTEKVSYSECIFLLGLNELLFKLNRERGLEQLQFAEAIINDIDGEPELKISIYGRLAQYYLGIFELQRSRENLKLILSLKEHYPQAELSLMLYNLVIAQTLLHNGQYQDALKTLDYCIEESNLNGLSNDTFSAGLYLLQAKAYNRIKDYTIAKKIAKKIYDQEILKNYNHDIIPVALTELSIAENGLNNSKLALEYAKKAKIILLKDKNRNNSNVLFSVDIHFANACIAEANALSFLGNINDALEIYLTAEIIYYNIYKNNIKYTDDASYLYYNAAMASKNMPNKSLFNKFLSKHIKYFGIYNYRSVELIN